MDHSYYWVRYLDILCHYEWSNSSYECGRGFNSHFTYDILDKIFNYYWSETLILRARRCFVSKELVDIWRQLSFLSQESLINNNRILWISKGRTLSLLFLSTDNFRYDHLFFKLCICLGCLIACITSLFHTVWDSIWEYYLHVIVFENNLTFFENFTLNCFPTVWLYYCLAWNI